MSSIKLFSMEYNFTHYSSFVNEPQASYAIEEVGIEILIISRTTGLSVEEIEKL